MFSHLIWQNLKVYVDDVIVKTTKGHNHVTDLEDVLQSIMKYNTCLNPAKFSFRVQVEKFLGCMPMKRGIKANPDKCQTVTDMRSPTNIKEV